MDNRKLYIKLSEYSDRNFFKKLIVSFFILSLILFSTSNFGIKANAQGWGGGNRASSVKVEKPLKEVLSTTKEVRGKIVTSFTTSVSSVINGLVNIEDIKIGDKLTAGQIIAKQDSSNLFYELNLKENLLLTAQLNLQEIKQDLINENKIYLIIKEQNDILLSKYERAKKLANKNAISKQELETVTSSYLSSQQQVLLREQTNDRMTFREKLAINNINKLNVEISKLKNDISDTNLKSPIDGQVVDLISIKSGFIRTGESVAVIQNLNDFEIELEVPVNLLEQIVQSKEINGFDIHGNEIIAQYRVTLPKENPRTGTRSVRLNVMSEMRGSLQANNASLSLLIPTSKPSPVLTISKDAIIPVTGGNVVFILNDGKAIKKVVKLGGAVGEKTIILRGISENDEVIVRGNELLKDGSSVKIAGAPSKKKKPSKAIEGDKWVLKWQSSRGEQTGDLLVGKQKSTFNDTPVEVKISDKKMIFDAPIVLPFGTITLSFDGLISSNKVSGNVITKLPNGNENSAKFSGEKVKTK